MTLPTAPEDTAEPTEQTASTRRTWILLAIALCVTAAVALAFTNKHPLPSAAEIRAGIRAISFTQLALGVLAINGGVVIRAVRWALLMPRENRPPATRLIAPQFVGFAAVALFGRVADLTRPYLVARRTATPVAMQVAVYSVERALDLAATAVLFSVTLLFVPRSAPHHEAFSRSGILASAATLCLLGFALAIRQGGQFLAQLLQKHLQRFAPKLAHSLAARILEMQVGFSEVGPAALAMAFFWSLVIWFGIALAYLFSTHSLPGTPQLANLGLAAIMLLMATSMGASLLQLPVVGWFTQIAALAAAYHSIFGVPAAPAALCGLLTFLVNAISVVPVGLILARWSGLSLREGRASASAQPG